MKLIREMQMRDDIPCSEYKIIKASRVVLSDNEGKIAIIKNIKENYYKLPETVFLEGEDMFDALERVSLEKIGANIDISDDVGMIMEYRNIEKSLIISYCIKAIIVGKLVSIKENKKEILEWKTIDEAIKLFIENRPTSYETEFIIGRDLLCLKEVKEAENKKTN